jgi:hypothetical protein
MKHFYLKSLAKTIIIFLIFFLLCYGLLSAQACPTASGDQTTYGTNNVWMGYVYTGQNFNNYQGYVNEGTASSPNFNEGFGGGGVTYHTNGCSITTDNFSVRYKLKQSFTGNFTITVGGDDGYRLSLDGGVTFPINNWNDHGYTTTSYNVNLSGLTNFVLEFYQNGGANEVSFNIVQNCIGTGDTTVYGTGNIWNGYVFQGMNFQTYKGQVNEGSSANAGFDENFGNPGGSNNNTYNTNSCAVQTSQFSARYRLTQTFAPGNYAFTVGGDDGVRLSFDGGNTFVVNAWHDQSYTVYNYNVALSGTYNMVLDYYQNGGYDRVTYNQTFTTLPITLNSFSATAKDNSQTLLNWTTANAVNFDHFVIQRSTNGSTFSDVSTVAAATEDSTSTQSYSYTDQDDYDGTLYYRLVMVDKDGKFSYSNILSISLQKAKTIRIYPTVVESGTLFISSSSAVTSAKMELFDMNGNRLQENDWSSLQGVQPVAVGGHGKLPAGAYIVRLSNNQTTLTKQMIIVR